MKAPFSFFFVAALMILTSLSACKKKKSATPGFSRYITTKNRKNTPERLELKKYNPILKRMTIHKEIK